MSLQRCFECSTQYQPFVGGATLKLCSDCISAGLNDSLYDKNDYEEDLHKKEEDEIPLDFLSDENDPDEPDDLD